MPSLANSISHSDPLGLVGQAFAGQFRIEEVVAVGPGDVVYRARRPSLGQTVAIRCWIPPALAASADPGGLWAPAGGVGGATRGASRGVPALLATLREWNRRVTTLTASTRDLVHPISCGAVPIGGSSVPYLVSEWLDGRPLSQELAARRARNAPPMPLAELLPLLAPAALALGFAHAHGLGHFDLSPAKLFLVLEPRAVRLRVVDLGVGQAVREHLAGGADRLSVVTARAPASAPYVAPEQRSACVGGAVLQSDVYAFARIVVALMAPGAALMTEGAQALALLRATGVPAEVDAVAPVLERALCTQIADRQPTIGALWQALLGAASAGGAYLARAEGSVLGTLGDEQVASNDQESPRARDVPPVSSRVPTPWPRQVESGPLDGHPADGDWPTLVDPPRTGPGLTSGGLEGRPAVAVALDRGASVDDDVEYVSAIQLPETGEFPAVAECPGAVAPARGSVRPVGLVQDAPMSGKPSAAVADVWMSPDEPFAAALDGLPPGELVPASEVRPRTVSPPVAPVAQAAAADAGPLLPPARSAPGVTDAVVEQGLALFYPPNRLRHHQVTLRLSDPARSGAFAPIAATVAAPPTDYGLPAARGAGVPRRTWRSSAAVYRRVIVPVAVGAAIVVGVTLALVYGLWLG